MKRIISFMLAMVLVLSLSVTAFATEATQAIPNGSITITNATVGETYYLYKVFNTTYAVDAEGEPLLDANGKHIASYTIESGDKFYDMMFGNNIQIHDELGQASTYFNYNAETGVVTQKDGISLANLYKYLGWVAEKLVADDSTVANGLTVVFDELETGYYLINRGVASTVTITTNAPDVQVIDKNQKPNVDNSFNKLVWDEDKGEWVESSTANIGDIIEWKIPFTATNYDGEYLVQYYSIRDRKTSSLWVEFNSIDVTVDGTPADGMTLSGKGYYWCAGPDSLNTGDWTAEKQPNVWTDNPNEADWFLIHYGYDDFEIVIPWLDDFTFEGVKSLDKGYKLTFDLRTDDENNVLSEPIYKDSVNDVVVTYTASVGPDAANTTAQNEAELDWTTVNGTSGPEDSEITTIKAYNMGITKVANDGTASTPATRLAGAIFKLYKNYDPVTKTYSNPVYVIPTGEPGVYILDDVDTVISGNNRTTSREKYAESVWADYIISDPEPEAADGATDEEKKAANRRNDVETPEGGQLVVMGLEAGEYYLEETKAPDGYNLLADAVKVTVGSGDTNLYDNGYTVYSKVIENNRGVELPSTGGKGTMMLITFGTVVAMAFAVLMITQKKMSIYND